MLMVCRVVNVGIVNRKHLAEAKAKLRKIVYDEPDRNIIMVTSKNEPERERDNKEGDMEKDNLEWDDFDAINLVAEIDVRLAMLELPDTELESDLWGGYKSEAQLAYANGARDALRSLRDWIVEKDEGALDE